MYSILLNICSLWGGAICFGKPFFPASVYSFGIFLIAVAYRKDCELVEWIEKLFVILSVFSLVIEYFFYAIQYWISTHKNQDIRSVSVMFFVCLIFFYVSF
jgi:hypothetical protein